MTNKQKKLGQHFLLSKQGIKKIVAALDLKKNDVILEIGPGHGELTQELKAASHESRIIAIEKDPRLAENLASRLKNVEIIRGDALIILPSLIHDSLFTIQNFKIVGNIPYYITGRLLRVLGELEPKPELIVLTVQKEVAERMCATPKMNLLAASVQFWSSPEIIEYISRKDFRPQPKVDSAVIKLTTHNSKPKTHEPPPANYYKLVKFLFKQPRKTILNNLQEGDFCSKNELRGKLTGLEIDPEARPQNLSVEIIKKLSRMLYN